MADQTVQVRLADSSAEEVAYRLLERIATIEKKNFSGGWDTGETVPDRKWILDTYAECLEAAKGNRDMY
ncbi:MAG: hypothetical protein ACRC67_33280 [Inquilinus sp.]|uniref:hypothetical protein n=1 Tax=Inquilinus sp. TaxID=1932117 RepID=UPI003F3B3D1B